LFGGILIPFLVSFVDISLRSLLQETLSADTLMYVSFLSLFMMYSIAYYYLWRHFVQRKGLEHQKLLEFGTLLIILSDIMIYLSLYQVGNNLSNFTWLGFYLLLIGLFYILGKRSINHSQTKQSL